MPDEEKLKILYQRYTKLAIVSLFLMALLQGLHSFFLTIFFWLSLGFGILAINYFIAAKREAEPNVSWDDQGKGAAPVQNKKNILIIIVSIVFVFILFINIVTSIFSSSKSEDKRTENQSSESTEEQTSQESSQENQPTVYQIAAKEFDNQNYKRSITLCRKELLNQPDNLDFILLLGDNYGSLKQYDSSFVWFNKAYQLGARSAYLSHWMGYFYDEKGETSRAIEFYKDALQQDSSRTQLYDRLAELIPEKADWYRQKSKQWSSK